MLFSPWLEIVDVLATIHLDEERINHYPPIIIILQNVKILFQTIQLIIDDASYLFYYYILIEYEQNFVPKFVVYFS